MTHLCPVKVIVHHTHAHIILSYFGLNLLLLYFVFNLFHHSIGSPSFAWHPLDTFNHCGVFHHNIGSSVIWLKFLRYIQLLWGILSQHWESVIWLTSLRYIQSLWGVWFPLIIFLLSDASRSYSGICHTSCPQFQDQPVLFVLLCFLLQWHRQWLMWHLEETVYLAHTVLHWGKSRKNLKAETFRQELDSSHRGMVVIGLLSLGCRRQKAEEAST